MTITVLLADDQAMVRASLRIILEDEPGISVVAEAADGEEAVALARELRPDVCLVDVRMPRLDGVAVTRALAGPGVPDPLRVVVVTTFDLDAYVHGALLGGAAGFVLKDAGPALLVEAVRAAHAGGRSRCGCCAASRALARAPGGGPCERCRYARPRS
ncbi:response regulator transcription factor [Nonomuraea sp. RK-328]|nr:response regulator transcription factor [Nonomuraea sp. RK-328]